MAKQENYKLVDTITLTDLPPSSQLKTLQAPNLTFPFRIVTKVDLKSWRNVSSTMGYTITIRKGSGVLYNIYAATLARDDSENPKRTRMTLGVVDSSVYYYFDDCDYFYIDQTFINISTTEISIWGHLNKEDTPRLLKDKTLLHSPSDDGDKYDMLNRIILQPIIGRSVKEITFYIFQI